MALVRDLRGPWEEYRRDAVQAVADRITECEPFLIRLVGEALEDPDAFDAMEGPESCALIYAMHVLAWEECRSAHHPLLQVLRLDPVVQEVLFGEAFAEYGSIWLVRTCGGRADGILSAARDPRLDGWSRWLAIDALVLLTVDDDALRSEVVTLCSELLEDPELEDGDPAVDGAVLALVDLGDAARREQVADAIRSGRVESNLLAMEDIEGRAEDPAAIRERGLLGGYLPEEDLHALGNSYFGPNGVDAWDDSDDFDDPDDWDAWDDEPMEFAWDSDACALDDDGQPVNPRACELWIDGLLDAFFTSPEGQALADEQMEHGQLLHHYALSYRGETLRTLGPDDVRYVLTELYPRKVQADPEEADDIVTELRALFSFLEREYGAENAAACRAALTDELRDELAEGLADPSRFGVAKSFLASGRAAGFAMDSQEDLDAFAALENQRLHTEREARAGQESRSSNARKKGAKKAKKAKRKQAKKSRKRNR